MRECASCNACCSGVLKADIYGIKMGPNRCSFLCQNNCTIYPIRPQLCKDYQCLWSQNILPEEYRPDNIGIMVSVEKWPNGQFLRIIKMHDKVRQEHIDVIVSFATENNAPYIITGRDGIQIYGPNKFIQHIQLKTEHR